MTDRIQVLLHDNEGNAAIELSLIAPILITLVLGITDISRAYLSKIKLEQAAHRAIERVQQYQTTSSTYSTLKAEAASGAEITESSTNPMVDWWLECNGVRQNNYESSCSAGQTQARWIEVRITKPFTPTFGTKYFPGANADGTYTLRGKAGMRTQ